MNTSTRIDLQLQPGNVTESVEVTAATPILETDRADTGAKIEQAVGTIASAGGSAEAVLTDATRERQRRGRSVGSV